MSLSVQNNSSALLALQTLGRLNEQSQTMGDAASAASTSSATAADPVIQALSVSQSAAADPLSAVSASLDRAASITDVALSAGQSIAGLLDQMKQAAAGASDGTVGATGSQTDFAALVKQVSDAIDSAQFDGVNLLNGSQGTSVQLGAGAASSVSLTAQDLSLGGGVITLPTSASISTQTTAAAALSAIDTSIANLGTAMGQIGDQARQIQGHAGFVSKLGASLSTDPSSTSLSSDSARLMALSVQQQLAGQSSGIANSAPQMLLGLFK